MAQTSIRLIETSPRERTMFRGVRKTHDSGTVLNHESLERGKKSD